MDSQDDPSWPNYPNTILAFDNHVVVDLRCALTDANREQLSYLSIAAPFAVISAANSRGSADEQSVNDSSASVLHQEITRRGFAALPVHGISADGTHSESSFAVSISISEARRLAIDADQSAYFWYDGTVFWLLGAIVNSPPLQLPVR